MDDRFYHNLDTTISRMADRAHNETYEKYQQRMETEHPGDVIFYDMFTQRFAELIVRECARLAYTGPDGILASFGFKK